MEERTSWKPNKPDYTKQHKVNIDAIREASIEAAKKGAVSPDFPMGGRKTSLSESGAEAATFNQQLAREEQYELHGTLAKEKAPDALSAAQLQAIAEELRRQYIVVEKARQNLHKAARGDDELNLTPKLAEELGQLKQMVLADSQVTEETYALEDGDGDEVQRAKNKIKEAVEYIRSMQ